MEKVKIFDAELRMMQVLWEKEPIGTGELSKICTDVLEWNKSTTYTVIRRLVDRGVLNKQRTVLTSKLSKNDVQMIESDVHIEKMYNGSLNNFFETYLKNADLKTEELQTLKDIIREKDIY
ncbi:MAG: BlaI/MecI/CopY family transcriptional regulator [Proteocatella sp.]